MFKNLFIAILTCAILFSTSGLKGQETEPDTSLIQFSGFVIAADSSSPVPYANIKIQNEPRGTVTNLEGFFSMPVRPNDTIMFGSMGFKTSTYVIPGEVKNNKLTHVQTLPYDTIALKEAVVTPLPSKEEFRDAFLNLELGNEGFDMARKNLNVQQLNRISDKLPNDARENYNYAIQQFHDESFYKGANRPFYTVPGSGTPIPGSLLNPLAWSDFIESIGNDED